MRKSVKIFSLLAALILTASMVLTGCASSKNGTASSNGAATTADSAAAGTEQSGEVTPLQIYMIGGSQPVDADAVMDAANEYLKDKINVSIKFTVFDYGDFPQKMSVKCAAAEKFDIMFTSFWTSSTKYNTCVQNKWILDITDMMDKYAPETKAALGSSNLQLASVGGRLYGIPVQKEFAHNYQLMYRKDIADQLNLDMSNIKQLSDVEPILAQVKKAMPTIYPFQSTPGESAANTLDFELPNGFDTPAGIYPAWAGKTGDEATKIVDLYETPEAMSLFTLLHKWYNLGYIRKDSDTITNFLGDITVGKVFCLVQPGKPGKDAELSAQTKQNFKAIDITQPYIAHDAATGAMMAISSTSANPDKALQFLNLWNTDKYINNLMVFGIEEKNYSVVDKEKGIIKLIGDGYGRAGSGWSQANQFLNFVTTTEDPEKWEKFKTFNAKALTSAVPSDFVYTPDNMKTQIANVAAAKKQYISVLECGKGDPAKYIPLMVEKFKDNGLDDIIADMQKQLDAALKK